MPRLQVTGLLFVASLVAFTLTATSVRFYFMYQSARDPPSAAGNINLQNELEDIYAIGTWSSLECWSVALAFGLLPLRVYLRRLPGLRKVLKDLVARLKRMRGGGGESISRARGDTYLSAARGPPAIDRSDSMKGLTELRYINTSV